MMEATYVAVIVSRTKVWRVVVREADLSLTYTSIDGPLFLQYRDNGTKEAGRRTQLGRSLNINAFWCKDKGPGVL